MALQYDFFAPFVRVSLTRQDGTRLPLWFGPDSLKNADAFQYADAPNIGGIGTNLAIVSNVEIEQALGNFFTITVTCSPTFEDAMALFESDAIVTGDTLVEVQYGYVAGGGQLATRIFTGLLTDPDFSIGSEISVTLKAQATCAAAMLGAEAPPDPEFAKGLSRLEMIKRLAAGLGTPKRVVTVDDSSVKGTEERRLLSEVLAIDTGGKNENVLLRDIVEQCLCEVYYTPDPKDPAKPVLKVIGREERFGGSGTKEFRLASFGTAGVSAALGGQFEGGGIYPILSVSTQSKQVFIRGVVHGTVKPRVDESKKVEPKVVVEQADAKGTPGLAPDASPKKQGKKRPKPSPNTPGLNEQTKAGGMVQTGVEDFKTQKALNQEQEFKSFIDSGVQLSVESVGIPDLEPGAIVAVKGLGKRFDGQYSLLKVMHSIGENGYTTRWDGINNAGYLYARDEALKNKTKAIVAASEAELKIEAKNG